MDYDNNQQVAVPRRNSGAALHPSSRPKAETFAQCIRDHLSEVLASNQFDGASRSRDFLSFIVEESLTGRAELLNQSVIATRVFGRKSDFDAILDPVVRVQAGRLRRSLERYYLLTGNHSVVRIELPKGSYAPVFVSNEIQDPAAQTRAKRLSLSVVAPEWPSVLIRPLECAQAHQDQSIRLEDELTMEIVRYGDVRVIRQRDMERLDPQYQGSLRFELRGRLRMVGDDTVVNVCLIDRSNGEQIWSEEFHTASVAGLWSAAIEDIPLVIAARIASESGVIVRLLASEHGRDRTESSRSVDAILGCYHFFFSRQVNGFIPILEALRRSTLREPEVALGWMYLARLYQINYAFEIVDVPTPVDNAIHYAYQGLLLDPSSARIRSVLASCLLVKGELQAARDELDHALRMNRGSLAYREIIGWLLALSGDWDRGVVIMRDAVARNPYCLSQVRHGLWADAMRRGQYDEAYTMALEYPDRVFFWRDLMMASALGLLGRVQEARASVAELLRMRPDFARRGRTIIGHYIKPQDVRDRIAEGCRKAGLTLL